MNRGKEAKHGTERSSPPLRNLCLNIIHFALTVYVFCTDSKRKAGKQERSFPDGTNGGHAVQVRRFSMIFSKDKESDCWADGLDSLYRL